MTAPNLAGENRRNNRPRALGRLQAGLRLDARMTTRHRHAVKENTLIGSATWTPERTAIYRLALSGGIGPCRYAQLRERFGSATDALAGLRDMRRKDVRSATDRDVETAVKAAADADARIVLAGDAAYPQRLAEISRPPMTCAFGNSTFITSFQARQSEPPK